MITQAPFPALGLREADRVFHELRKPLAVIQAFAELLREEVSGPLNEAQRDQAQTILKNSRDLEELFERIYGFVEMLDPSYAGRTEPCNGLELCERVMQGLRAGGHQAHWRTVAKYAAAESWWIEADEARLTRALSLASDYLLRAQPKEAALEVTLEAEEDWVVLTMESPESQLEAVHADHLFDPFPGQVPRFGRDLGIELCWARHTLRNHGGDLLAYFTRGLTFEARIPKATL